MTTVSMKQRQSSSLQSRIKEEAQEFATTFEGISTFSTQSESLNFMKQLTGIGISSILYHRSVFPKTNFGNRKLGEVPLKILRAKDEASAKMIKCLAGCFDALSRNYLREAIVGIYVDKFDQETVLETYTFGFEYSKEGVPALRIAGKSPNGWLDMYEYKGPRHIQKTTRDVLKKMTSLLSNMTALPDEVYVTIRLNYYDERTPADYEPPGFMPTQNKQFKFSKGKTPTALTIGRVATKFHGCKLRVKSLLLEDDEDSIDEEMELESSTTGDQSKTSKNGPPPTGGRGDGASGSREPLTEKRNVNRNLFHSKVIADAAFSVRESPMSVSVPPRGNCRDAVGLQTAHPVVTVKTEEPPAEQRNHRHDTGGREIETASKFLEDLSLDSGDRTSVGNEKENRASTVNFGQEDVNEEKIGVVRDFGFEEAEDPE